MGNVKSLFYVWLELREIVTRHARLVCNCSPGRNFRGLRRVEKGVMWIFRPSSPFVYPFFPVQVLLQVVWSVYYFNIKIRTDFSTFRNGFFRSCIDNRNCYCQLILVTERNMNWDYVPMLCFYVAIGSFSTNKSLRYGSEVPNLLNDQPGTRIGHLIVTWSVNGDQNGNVWIEPIVLLTECNQVKMQLVRKVLARSGRPEICNYE